MKPTTTAMLLELLARLFAWLWIGLWVAAFVAAYRWWAHDLSGWWAIGFAAGAMFSKAVAREYMAETRQVQVEAAGAQFAGLIRDYGPALEMASAPRNVVTDEEKLPASKAEIKAALLQALSEGGLAEELRQHLKNAYVALSQFQAEVGHRVVALPSQEESEADTQAVAARIAGEEGREYFRWTQVVQEEQGELIEELRAAGHWE